MEGILLLYEQTRPFSGVENIARAEKKDFLNSLVNAQLVKVSDWETLFMS